VGFVVDKVALGQVFSEYFGFPCQFSFHQLLHNHHHLSSGGWYNRPTVADVPSGLSLASPRETLKKKKHQKQLTSWMNSQKDKLRLLLEGHS
jgi:hypothetical protein